MQILADLHMHTTVSTHAFATLNEMCAQAHTVGLKAVAITDHGPAMPDSPHEWYFNGLLRLPSLLPNGLWLLKGVEANVVSAQGELDMPEKTLRRMDWVIASLHGSCIPPLSQESATAAWLAIAENPLVDMIGHAEQSQYAFDIDRVTRAFAAGNKVVEMNVASRQVRPGNEEILRKIALACKQNGVKIAVTTDSHSTFTLGDYGAIPQMLREIDFPEERIINTGMPRLTAELALHGRSIAEKLAAAFGR